jgi:hypothetical protein
VYVGAEDGALKLVAKHQNANNIILIRLLTTYRLKPC